MVQSYMTESGEHTESFTVRDCALVALATGRKARLLQEFRSEIASIDAASIYHHFWGGLLQPRFEEREYNNDFAAWIHHGIHDAVLAERLAALTPTGFSDLEELRHEIIELVEARLDESEPDHCINIAVEAGLQRIRVPALLAGYAQSSVIILIVFYLYI